MDNCILLHLHHQDLWPEFWHYIKQIKNDKLDIFATVHTKDTQFFNDIKNNVDEIYLIENRGVDFGGFLYAYNKIKNNPYKTITKLHGKKRSPYTSDTLGELDAKRWRNILYTPLIEKKFYYKMINCFESDDKMCMYGSKHCFRKEQKDDPWALENISAFNKINSVLDLPETNQYNFIAGSIFTVSKNYLDWFFKNKEMDLFQIMETDFPKNGTIAHGLERLIGSCIFSIEGRIGLI